MLYSAFFYGTLMHPAILRRVIGHDGGELEICPAVLLEHTRHKIKHADYPAVIPYSKSRALFEESGQCDLSPEDRTVRGTFVQGLNDRDVSLLDLFEGDEYTRDLVEVHPLGPLAPLSSASKPTHGAPIIMPLSTQPQGAHSELSEAATDAYIIPRTAPELPPLHTLAAAVTAHTYIYAGPLSGLSAELWSYDDFVRESAWKWVGGNPLLGEYYAEVDRRREMEGKTLQMTTGVEGASSAAEDRTAVAVVGTTA
ncbi:hypothetical protein BC628DRAFT_16836 [Trametes gibbosa]|nr:hypothetical protein BC628DRAFT_16836 [Trametes gibbosa]